MSPARHRRRLWAFSILLVAAVTCAGYWLVRWGYLRLQAALGEEQTQMFDECRIQALQSSQPEKIAGLIQAVIIYYPSGSKQTAGSHLDRMVERSRQAAIRDMIAHLRVTTGVDLGNDPEAWIARYREEAMVQPDGLVNWSQPIRLETNPTPSAAGSGR